MLYCPVASNVFECHLVPYEASFCLRLRRGQHHDGASGRQAGAGLLESVSWKKEEAKKTIAKLKPLHSSYMSD